MTILQALCEMKGFMVVNGVPDKQRQKLLRNLRVVELLVKLLQTPYRGSPDQQYVISHSLSPSFSVCLSLVCVSAVFLPVNSYSVLWSCQRSCYTHNTEAPPTSST